MFNHQDILHAMTWQCVFSLYGYVLKARVPLPQANEKCHQHPCNKAPENNDRKNFVSSFCEYQP